MHTSKLSDKKAGVKQSISEDTRAYEFDSNHCGLEFVSGQALLMRPNKAYETYLQLTDMFILFSIYLCRYLFHLQLAHPLFILALCTLVLCDLDTASVRINNLTLSKFIFDFTTMVMVVYIVHEFMRFTTYM